MRVDHLQRRLRPDHQGRPGSRRRPPKSHWAVPLETGPFYAYPVSYGIIRGPLTCPDPPSAHDFSLMVNGAGQWPDSVTICSVWLLANGRPVRGSVSMNQTGRV
ncbi:hypothetical protein GCM10023063_37000 [Arthrobacter methylotrophus]